MLKVFFAGAAVLAIGVITGAFAFSIAAADMGGAYGLSRLGMNVRAR